MKSIDIISADMEPFFVTYDGKCYIVHETKVHERGKKIGTTYDTVIGYYNSLDRALLAIIKIKSLGEDSVIELKDVLKNMQRFKNEILYTDNIKE